jgi:hypothetical protein
VELLALNRPITNPRKLIDKWESLIWTLRYQEPGEFELKTAFIEETIADLPLGSFVAINEGDEIMMVENYEINQGEDGKDILTVSGRSVMSFLEYRTALDEYLYYHDYSTDLEGKQVEGDVHAWLINSPGGNANDADIAAFIMYRHLVEGVFNSPNNAIRPEVIPNLSIVQQDATNRRPYIRYIERGNLLAAVQAILLAGNNGFKSKRAIGSAVNTEFIVYKGLNRTREQSTNAPMILRHDQGHILSPRYLFSIKGHYNSFRIFPTRWPMFTDTVWGPGNTLDEPERMGWDYRELLIDATEITSDDLSIVDPAMMQRLATEKAKNLPIQILECTVAENIPYVFGLDYNLGDLCTVMGDFNIVENAQITEYVKVEDALGERSSPGLKIIQ